MQLYSCKVRLDGSLYHEVVKPEVTIPEIVVLRYKHKGKGETGDVVTDIKPLGREAYDLGPPNDEGKSELVLRTDAVERARLRRIYDPDDKFMTSKLFFGNALPQALEGIGGTVSAEPVRRQRRPAQDPVAEMTV